MSDSWKRGKHPQRKVVKPRRGKKKPRALSPNQLDLSGVRFRPATGEPHNYISFNGDIPHAAEVVFNLAIAQVSGGKVAECCYMVSEAIAGACREHGLRAEAILCDVYAWNADAEQLMKNPELLDEWVERANLKSRRRRELNLIQPKFIGIDHEQVVEGDGYDGHVVVRIGDRSGWSWVLDATFGQFARPHHNIVPAQWALIPWQQFVAHDYLSNIELIEPKSVAPGKVAMRAGPEGFFTVCLRPDLDSEEPAYFDHTPTARTNIAAFTKDLIVDSKALIRQMAESPKDEYQVGASAQVELDGEISE